jgi:carbon-monoxide dehydrogenase small subunit
VPKQDVHFVVNGAPRTVHVEPTRFLIDVLRDDLGLTGTKHGCGIGVCGACTVLVDGLSMSACLVLVGQCDERAIVTIEGLGAGAELHPIQSAFLECDALQCGYCTPGQIMAACALLQEEPSPSDEAIRQGMLGNLCRCTGYYPIRDAVRVAAERLLRPTE